MAYCTKADILEQLDEDELIGLTDDNDLGAVDDGKVDRAIADADAEIDGYCGKRYSVPFSPVPAILRKISVELAVVNLFARRRGVPEDRRKRYEDMIRFLRDVAKGLVSLGAGDPDSPPSDADKPQIASGERIFTREKLEGF